MPGGVAGAQPIMAAPYADHILPFLAVDRSRPTASRGRACALRKAQGSKFDKLAGLFDEKTVGGAQCRIGPPPESRRLPRTPKTIKGEQPAQNNARGLQNSYAGMGV